MINVNIQVYRINVGQYRYSYYCVLYFWQLYNRIMVNEYNLINNKNDRYKYNNTDHISIN
jgi:hypothetical protein